MPQLVFSTILAAAGGLFLAYLLALLGWLIRLVLLGMVKPK